MNTHSLPFATLIRGFGRDRMSRLAFPASRETRAGATDEVSLSFVRSVILVVLAALMICGPELVARRFLSAANAQGSGLFVSPVQPLPEECDVEDFAPLNTKILSELSGVDQQKIAPSIRPTSSDSIADFEFASTSGESIFGGVAIVESRSSLSIVNQLAETARSNDFAYLPQSEFSILDVTLLGVSGQSAHVVVFERASVSAASGAYGAIPAIDWVIVCKKGVSWVGLSNLAAERFLGVSLGGLVVNALTSPCPSAPLNPAPGPGCASEAAQILAKCLCNAQREFETSTTNCLIELMTTMATCAVAAATGVGTVLCVFMMAVFLGCLFVASKRHDRQVRACIDTYNDALQRVCIVQY